MFKKFRNFLRGFRIKIVKYWYPIYIQEIGNRYCIRTLFSKNKVGRVITIWEAIWKRSHEPMCKTDTKN